MLLLIYDMKIAISNGNVQRVWDASQQVDACEAL